LGLSVGSDLKGEKMQRSKSDWREEKLAKIFCRYHSAIRARSGEGRQYAMRCFYAALVHEGMGVKKLGPGDGRPFDPVTGAGYLLVENAFVLDVVYTQHITPYNVLLAFSQMPVGHFGIFYRRFVFNFGSAAPEWYPRPMDAAEWKTFLDLRWEMFLSTPTVFSTQTQPTSLKWEAPYVR